MNQRNPALWENGQYLMEGDPVYENRFSEAAMKAQKAKWKRLMDARGPRDQLPKGLLAQPGKTPPLYRFGFPFTRKYALDYARRHHLKIVLVEEDREEFGGQDELDFADVDDSWLEDRDKWVFIMCSAEDLMIRDLSSQCRFTLELGSPFSREWDGIISFWSNYNMEERSDMCHDFNDVLYTLAFAMNETDDHVSLPQWWFDWDNDVGVFTSVE